MPEVCSGSSKVPLQHGQNPCLHLSVSGILQLPRFWWLKLQHHHIACHVDFWAIQKTCSAMLCNCMCFAALLLHLLCSNAFIPDLQQLHVFCRTCLTAWQQHCCDCIFRTACSPVLYLLCSHLDLGSHTGMKRLMAASALVCLTKENYYRKD